MLVSIILSADNNINESIISNQLWTSEIVFQIRSSIYMSQAVLNKHFICRISQV